MIYPFIHPDVLWKLVTMLPGGTKLSHASRNESSRVMFNTGSMSSKGYIVLGNLLVSSP